MESVCQFGTRSGDVDAEEGIVEKNGIIDAEKKQREEAAMLPGYGNDPLTPIVECG